MSKVTQRNSIQFLMTKSQYVKEDVLKNSVLDNNYSILTYYKA